MNEYELIIDNDWVSPEECRATMDDYVPVPKSELDEATGLPIVKRESVYEKYGIYLQPEKNSFHKSLQEQFDKRGTLSAKQIACIRKN